jgi:signal transduction histidine kinase
MAKLVFTRGKSELGEYILGQETTLGRSSRCDVCVPSRLSSREHARVASNRGLWFIEDLGSSNGTLVNGRKVTKAQLRNGDVIGIGEYEMTFLFGDAHVPPPGGVVLDDAVPTVVETLDMGAPPARAPDLTDSAVAERLRRHLAVLQEMADATCGALEAESLVRNTLERLLHVFQQADYAHALLEGFGDDGGDLSLTVARPGQRRRQVGCSRALVDIATQERKALLADMEAGAVGPTGIGEPAKCLMCTPLAIGRRILGAVQVDTANTLKPFGVADLELLATVAGQVAIAADSARLHREAIARQRLAAVGDAVSSIASVMWQELEPMSGGTYIVDAGLRRNDLADIAKGWDMVRRNTEAAADIVKDMLTYCRSGEVKREATDVRQLLDAVMATAGEAAQRRGITLELVGGEGLPVAEIDADAVRRALLNLIANAVEACPQGSRIELVAEVTDAGDELKIAVSDNGPGMSAEARRHLFTPFFTTKGKRGTGLGLALVHKVVDEHHGRISVETEPGQGTTFRVSLPVSWDEEETRPIK